MFEEVIMLVGINLKKDVKLNFMNIFDILKWLLNETQSVIYDAEAFFEALGS